MNRKAPNWTDIYTFEDYVKAQKAFATFDCGLSPVCLSAPDQHCHTCCDQIFGEMKVANASINIRTLKLEYAIQVWSKAVLISECCGNPLHYYWRLGYEDNSTSFRELKYLLYNESDYTGAIVIQGFWKLLEEIANSETIKVREGYTLANRNSFGPYQQFFVVLDMPAVESYEIDIDNIYEYPYDLTPRSYKWTEIKDLFVELTLRQLSLYDLKNLHKHTDVDKLLFKACNNLNLELAKQAIQLGANVNALDKYGESALQKTIEHCLGDGLFTDGTLTDEEKITIYQHNNQKSLEIVKYLLSQGAEVDLYGVEGNQPLMCAYYSQNYNMVKFLLEQGSNPNSFIYVFDAEESDEDEVFKTQPWNLFKVIERDFEEYKDFLDLDFQKDVLELAKKYCAHS